jgi:hypothetical protein
MFRVTRLADAARFTSGGRSKKKTASGENLKSLAVLGGGQSLRGRAENE